MRNVIKRVTKIMLQKARAGIISFLLVLYTANLYGCAGNIDLSNRQARSEDLAADDCFEAIVSAIENKDTESLKALFSPSALEIISEEDFTQSSENLFNFYSGNMKDHKGLLSSSKSKHSGLLKHYIRGDYMIITDKSTYYLVFHYFWINEEDPLEEGVSLIQIVSENAEETEGFYWDDWSKGPGIYIVDNVEDLIPG